MRDQMGISEISVNAPKAEASRASGMGTCCMARSMAEEMGTGEG